MFHWNLSMPGYENFEEVTHHVHGAQLSKPELNSD